MNRKELDRKIEQFTLIFAIGTAFGALWKAIIAAIDGCNDD